MSIIIVGLIVIFIGFVAAKADASIRPFNKLIKIAGVVVVLFEFSIPSVIQVEPGRLE
jgi:hypothetical protein